MPLQRPVLWVHEEALGPRNPALLAWPQAPALFVFDSAWISSAHISRKRIGFLYESALALPVSLRKGDVAAEVMAFAKCHTADGVVSSRPVDPRLQRIANSIRRQWPIVLLEPDAFVNPPRPPRLGRFSRYWRDAESVVWEGFTSNAS
ncbi:hypothetical protein [Synechococcus sp. UW140]|uniref:hypothetical protein n=1 Tax=Synechococcus sp. UW140 TaxID=368503 RepID=UPI000E0F25F2|nr:hypothetical protein [Synechococcus sp. UW140]